MKTLHYRCPITGKNVHGHLEVEEGTMDDSARKPLRCPSCGRVHMVNPTTGRLLFDADEFKRD